MYICFKFNAVCTCRVENEDTQSEIERVKANNVDLNTKLAESEAALKVRIHA